MKWPSARTPERRRSAAKSKPNWRRWTTPRRRIFCRSYGLHESGLVRLIRKSYELLGLISFFTAGEDECRAWTIPAGSKAPQGAGAIHSDLEHHFIRAETIRWDKLLEAGTEACARARARCVLRAKSTWCRMAT